MSLRRSGLGLLTGCALLSCGERAPATARAELGKNVQQLRPTETWAALQWHFDTDEVVESTVSPDGGFRVHYTRAGRNAIPALDLDDSGVPDLVEQVGTAYDEVAHFYTGQLQFRAPLGDGQLGGDGRFDVYLLDFAGASDGTFQVDSCPASNPDTCSGHVLQENDFAGYGYASALQGTRVLGSHEYFHAIQSAYDKTQGVVLEEGTAVWSSTRFDPALGELEGFADGYLSRPDRSLDSAPPGPVPPFAYGSAVFFEFLDENYGPDVIRQLWERCEKAPARSWLARLDELLQQQHGASFAQAFTQFARWNLYTGAAADSSQTWADARRFPTVASSKVDAPHKSPSPVFLFYASARYYRAPAAGRAQMTAAVVDDPTTAQDDTVGLSLHLVTRRAGKNASAATPDSVSAGTDVLDTTGNSELWVAVVNGAISGASRKPFLCIGAPGEVSACRASLSPAAPAAGMEVPDAGTSVQGAGDGSGAPAPSGCGCAGSGMGGMWSWIGLLGLLCSRSPRREP